MSALRGIGRKIFEFEVSIVCIVSSRTFSVIRQRNSGSKTPKSVKVYVKLTENKQHN